MSQDSNQENKQVISDTKTKSDSQNIWEASKTVSKDMCTSDGIVQDENGATPITPTLCDHGKHAATSTTMKLKQSSKGERMLQSSKEKMVVDSKDGDLKPPPMAEQKQPQLGELKPPPVHKNDNDHTESKMDESNDDMALSAATRNSATSDNTKMMSDQESSDAQE